MQSEIKIDCNYLRLLPDVFMHLQPGRDGIIKYKETYNVITDKYGIVGTVELDSKYDVELFNLKPAPMLLTFGHMNGMQLFKERRILNTEIIQHCFFRFKSRNSDNIKTLLDAETKKAGILIARQATLL